MSNIKINKIDAFNLEIPSYDDKELNLMSSSQIDFTFDSSTDFIEAKIYDESKNLIYSDGEFSDYGIYSYFTINENNIKLNVEDFIKGVGYENGSYYLLYNFYRKLCSDNNRNMFEYYIAEVDNTRTELRVKLIGENAINIKRSVEAFIQLRKDSPTFIDFIVSFGTENIIANNIKINEDSEDLELFIKLYEPLAPEFDVNSKLLFLSEINSPVGYNVVLEQEIVEEVLSTIPLSKPNFNINVTDYSVIDSKELSLNDITGGELFDMKNKFNSLISDKKYKINIDYNYFENFIHFSSAFKRFYNFIQKIRLIQLNERTLRDLPGKRTTNKQTANLLNQNINDVIESFDGFEYFLYYDFYPRTEAGETIKFLNNPLDNSENSEINPAIEDWYDSYSNRALDYDENNLDNLYWNIPEYLREDPKNYPYRLFIEMIGHSFDDIWVYIRNIKDLYNGDNRINVGISKELLTELLNNFGLKLYNGSYSTQDLYSSFLGTKRGVIPYENMSTSYEPGSEIIETYIDVEEGEMPLNDIEYKIFKRLYHNLPYLYKGKGTANVLKTLLNIYGIPQNTIKINEFGDKPKIKTTEGSILGQTLLPFTSLQQIEYSDTIDNEYNKYVEVGVSPQDQINQNIEDVLGVLDYDLLVGDPRNFRKGDNQYKPLVNLRNEFFQSYIKSYDLKDFVRLARFINNSLFKILRDFVPANTTISTGVIIKQHDLERLKTSPVDLDLKFLQYEALMKSAPRDYRESDPTFASDDRRKGSSIQVTSGGTGGMMEKYNEFINHPYYAGGSYNSTIKRWIGGDYGKDGVIQDISTTHPSIVGRVVEERTDQREFYNGELGLPIRHRTPEICRVHFSNEFMKNWMFDVSFYGNEGDTTTEDGFLKTGFDLEEGQLQIFLKKTLFDNNPNGEHHAPKYIKISRTTKTFDDGLSIDDFIISNTFMTLSFDEVNAWVFDKKTNIWSIFPISDKRSFTFTFYNVIKKANSYLIILDQTKTDHVAGYEGGESNNRTIFNVAGDYVWRAHDVFTDNPYRSIPQGYFPSVITDEFKTQYFRGYAQSRYFVGNNLIPLSPLPPSSGSYLNFFNKGEDELDGDPYNGVYYEGDVKLSTPSSYPWFMDGGSEFKHIEGDDFILKTDIINGGDGPITYLGVEFNPIGNINYSNIHQIITNFPGSNSFDGANKAILEVRINNVFNSSYEANNIKSFTSSAYPGDVIDLTLKNAILPEVPTTSPSMLKTKIYSIGNMTTPVAEINGVANGKDLKSTINTALYPNYGSIKTEAFRASLIPSYPNLELTLIRPSNSNDQNYPKEQTQTYRLVVSNKPYTGRIEISGQSFPALGRWRYIFDINGPNYSQNINLPNKQFPEDMTVSYLSPQPITIPVGVYEVTLYLMNGGVIWSQPWVATVQAGFLELDGTNAEYSSAYAFSYSENIPPENPGGGGQN